MNSVSYRYGLRFSSNRILVPAKYLLKYLSRDSSRSGPKVSWFTHLCGKSINVKPLINSNLKMHDSKAKNEVILTDSMLVYEILPQWQFLSHSLISGFFLLFSMNLTNVVTNLRCFRPWIWIWTKRSKVWCILHSDYFITNHSFFCYVVFKTWTDTWWCLFVPILIVLVQVVPFLFTELLFSAIQTFKFLPTQKKRVH